MLWGACGERLSAVRGGAALDAGADDNVCALVVYLNRHP